MRTISRRGRRASVVGAAMAAFMFVLVGGAAPAWAGPGFSVTVNIPSTVTVGQVLPAGPGGTFIEITNGSTDVGFETDSYSVDTITFLPSCGLLLGLSNASCPVGHEDPDVIRPAATGVGRALTTCDGIIFTFVPLNDTQGRYTLTHAAFNLGPRFTAPGSGVET